MRTVRRFLTTAAVAAAVLLATAPAFADATVVLLNADAPGAGLNDPAPAAPIAGNPGTTVGAQRRIALQHAAAIWGAQLDSPVPIRIFVSFSERGCTPTGAVLASAGAWSVFANFDALGQFPGPVALDTWHHSALADARAGAELSAGDPDLAAIFNVNLGQAACLAGSGWYYGLDGNEPADGIDLIAVALHEFAHGLGFQQFADLATGANLEGLTDVYARNLLDTTTFKTWDQMTDAERAASAVNGRKVAWNGAEVFAHAPSVLEPGVPILEVTAPAAIAGQYEVGTATFGPPLTAAGVFGPLVPALDGADAPGDACTAIMNAADVAGRIALVDRGTCTFTVKAANVQAAGAIAMVVADNAPGTPPAPLGGSDPAIAIPSVRITLADGNLIKAQLAGGTAVNVDLRLDLSRRAGMDPAGRVLMNATDPIQPGSSISHWDPVAFKNLLMEPSVNDDLTHSLVPPEDLTAAVMSDIGWVADADNDGVGDGTDQCPASDASAILSIDGASTGVANVVFASGCTMSDLIGFAAADAGNHGAFVSAVAHLASQWRDLGLITGAERGAIQRAAARSSIGK